MEGNDAPQDAAVVQSLLAVLLIAGRLRAFSVVLDTAQNGREMRSRTATQEQRKVGPG